MLNRQACAKIQSQIFYDTEVIQMSHHMGKPTICIGENKGADQLRSNCEADQRLCFCYSDSTIPLLLKSESSSFYLFSVLVQAGLCRTCPETTLLVFPRGGSNFKSDALALLPSVFTSIDFIKMLYQMDILRNSNVLCVCVFLFPNEFNNTYTSNPFR